jgi:sugar phosphate permease
VGSEMCIRDRVATVAGMVDGVGYIASILAGRQFGKIVDIGGYTLGFQCLAALALVSAFICLFLYRDSDQASSPA